MRSLIRSVLAILAAAQITMFAAPGQSQSLETKAALQAAMLQHIDRRTVDGAFLYLDTEKGEVRPIYPATAHPMIMTMGEHFVLCYDFRNGEGEKVEVDFYMTRKDDTYAVFHTALRDHDLLYRLIKQGKVARAD